MTDHPAYDDAVVVAADAHPDVTRTLTDAGYRILLLTGRHTVYVRPSGPDENRKPVSVPIRTSGRRTLTVTRAAAELGVSRSAAYAMVRTGTLPSVRLGRRIVVPVTALEELLSAQAPAAAS